LGMYNVVPKELKSGETIKLNEVKGYMSIEEASKATGFEVEQFYKKYQIPSSVPKETKMKEIAAQVPDYDYEKIKESLGETSGETKTEVPKTETSNTGAKYNLEGIKGSLTITAAAELVKLDVKEFYKLFQIPDSVPANTYMKDIGNSVPDYDFHKIIEENK
jgi:hypothetical protein